MSLYKRGNVYWIKFTTPSGEVIRRSTGTTDRKQAQELHDVTKAEQWRTAKLGEKPDRLWLEAATKWLEEKQDKASISTDALRLKVLLRDNPELASMRLSQITREYVRGIADTMKRDREAAPATLNHYVGTIRQIVHAAAEEWEWGNPTPRFKTYKKDNIRQRYGSVDEMKRLLATMPPHLRDLSTMALATGLRKGTLLKLTWRNVDFESRALNIGGKIMKARRDHLMPLNKTAWEVIERLHGKHPTALFTYLGDPVKDFSERTFNAALGRAGIDDFSFHDFRKTFATWLAKAGVPDRVIKVLGAWKIDASKDASVRYIWADFDTLRAAVAEIDEALGKVAPKRKATKRKRGHSLGT